MKVPMMFTIIITMQQVTVLGTVSGEGTKTWSLRSWNVGQWWEGVTYLKHLAWCLTLGTQYMVAVTAIVNGCQAPCHL